MKAFLTSLSFLVFASSAFAAGTFECSSRDGSILIKGQYGSEGPGSLTEVKLGQIHKDQAALRGTKVTVSAKKLSFKADNIVDGTVELRTVGGEMGEPSVYGGVVIIKAAIQSSDRAVAVECTASY